MKKEEMKMNVDATPPKNKNVYAVDPHMRLLDRNDYISPDVFEQEVENIFNRQWTYVGHVSQIPEPGDYFVEEFVGESIVVVRGEDEVVRAFLNTCRHRGHTLCQTQTGNVRSFTCPYHQWNYGLNGHLRRAPSAPDGKFFNYEEWSLHSVSLEVWQGLIFVRLSTTDDRPLGPELDRIGQSMMPMQAEKVKEIRTEVYEIKANWKTIIENYVECYHCLANHPELCVALDVGRTLSGITEAWHGEYIGGASPLKPGMQTASLNGELVCKKLLGDIEAASLEDGGIRGGFLIVPMITRVHFRADHGYIHTLRPVSPGHSQWVTRWYVHEDAVEGEDYEVEDVTKLWHISNQQDISLCEESYRGLNSRRFVSGPLHPERESAIASVIEVYKTLMSGSPAQPPARI
jgi:phenylpropionate dioxygenase-like ring-hydroxylating dioxygenase large terminal subunit